LEDTTTLFIDRGYTGTQGSHGHWFIERSGQRVTKKQYDASYNPIALEVFNHLFMSIATQMGNRLKQTAVSPNIKERLDFSCALFDSDGNLVANAPHVPVHLGAMGETVKSLCRTEKTFKPGDVYLTNDPHHGGSHLPDFTVITPVFLNKKDQNPAFFTASRAHHADIGGITPGAVPAYSGSIEQEGVLIAPLKIVDQNRPQHRRLKDLLLSSPYPARQPDENIADLNAQIAANHFGLQQLETACENYGYDVIRAQMQHIQDNAKLAVIDVLKQLPHGRHRFTDYLDDGTPISAELSIGKNQFTVDFSGTGPSVKGNLNAPRAVLTASILYVLRSLIRDPIPLNEGCLHAITVVVPEACILNPPKGVAVAAGNVETSQRIVDTLLGALHIAAASQGTMNNVTFGNPSFGYYETICGGVGAAPDYDGASAVHTHMTNTRITDVEILEHYFPIQLRSFSIRRNSGGRGRYKGGDGAVRHYRFLEELTVSIVSERRRRAPYGLEGGQPGRCGENVRVSVDGVRSTLDGKASYVAEKGEELLIFTPGGGGWGKPKQKKSI